MHGLVSLGCQLRLLENSCFFGSFSTTVFVDTRLWKTKGVFHLQKISEIFYWKFWEFPFGKRAFHLSICHKSHSFTSPSPSLHQKTRCLGKLFCYFLERVFVRRFPVKQMLIIGMYGCEKSDICMFPSF